MDDAGVADAFYTVLSICIVLVAAIGVSGVVLSTTLRQGDQAGSRMADLAQESMKKGLYVFYYSVDSSASDLVSGDPDDIVLKGLAVEKTADVLSMNASTLPPSAPSTLGLALWSGYFYAASDGSYTFQLKSDGVAWLWVDGKMVAVNSKPAIPQEKTFTISLTKGYHPLKAKYFYLDSHGASCSLDTKVGSQTSPVTSLYR